MTREGVTEFFIIFDFGTSMLLGYDSKIPKWSSVIIMSVVSCSVLGKAISLCHNLTSENDREGDNDTYTLLQNCCILVILAVCQITLLDNEISPINCFSNIRFSVKGLKLILTCDVPSDDLDGAVSSATVQSSSAPIASLAMSSLYLGLAVSAADVWLNKCRAWARRRSNAAEGDGAEPLLPQYV